MPSSNEPSRRPARLQELASWPVAWRERWGRRANQLEDQGTAWPNSEARAFDEVKAAKARGERPDADMGPPTKAAKAAKKTVETVGKLNLGRTS